VKACITNHKIRDTKKKHRTNIKVPEIRTEQNLERNSKSEIGDRNQSSSNEHKSKASPLAGGDNITNRSKSPKQKPDTSPLPQPQAPCRLTV
jgi:hypothetical protein